MNLQPLEDRLVVWVLQKVLVRTVRSRLTRGGTNNPTTRRQSLPVKFSGLGQREKRSYHDKAKQNQFAHTHMITGRRS